MKKPGLSHLPLQKIACPRDFSLREPIWNDAFTLYKTEKTVRLKVEVPGKLEVAWRVSDSVIVPKVAEPA